jgi:glycosyltransferase involved in cell wall biosynthesis
MNRPLNILHLTASLFVGGGERLVLELAQHTNRENCKPTVCAFGQFGPKSLLAEFQKLGPSFHLIPSTTLYSPFMVRAVWQHIRDRQIDVIHTHLVDADIVGSIVGRLAGVPVITTLHNAPENYARQRVDRRTLARLAAQYITIHLVAVSQEIRQQFIEQWHVSPERITAIRNSIVLNRFLDIALGTTNNDRLTVTNIASLNPQKAQHLLLEAAKIVLTQMPEVEFMIVGRGKLEQSLKEQAQALGIADRISFTGLRHDIPNVLAQSDIFVLSSLWEGLPVSALEAMGAARPVVLTDVGGNHELVESGIHGLLVPPGDAPALAQALLTLLRDKPRRLDMGRAARAQVQQKFSMDMFAHQYEDTYHAVWQKYRRQSADLRAVRETK